MDKDTIVDVLFGGQVLYGRCVGYCRRKGKYMTAKILKKKGCLGKQCQFLDKKEHQFWIDRQNSKIKRRG